jgi:dipeptidyl aminopeptidase/acylaminoacyl peptidase
MKGIMFCLVFTLHSGAVSCQKTVLDFKSLEDWPHVSNPKISSHGLFCAFIINGQPTGNRTLVVKKTDNSWKREFIGVSGNLLFVQDELIIFDRNDSLFFLSLGKDQINCITRITSWKWVQSNQKEWVAYQPKDSVGLMILKNLTSGLESRFVNVMDYYFSSEGNTLIVKTRSLIRGGYSNKLRWISLSDGSAFDIWSGIDSSMDNYVIGRCNFDLQGDQAVFIVYREKTGSKTVWYYKIGMEKAVIKINDFTEGMLSNVLADDLPEFSRNGKWIFVKIRRNDIVLRPNEEITKVDIWSYKDLLIQPEQRRILDLGPQTFSAAINVEARELIQLENEDVELMTAPSEITGDYAVISGTYIEPWWKFKKQPSFYLVSLQDGSRTLLKKEDNCLDNFTFSPKGNFLVFYDWKARNYFSYSIGAGLIANITKSIQDGVCNEYSSGIMHYAVAPVAGWGADDSSLIVYGNYDIWKIDPSGRRRAVNLTNWYGSKHHLKLRICEFDLAGNSSSSYLNNTNLLLSAFNTVNKYNGFYSLPLSQKDGLNFLCMGPFTFYHMNSQLPISNNELDVGMEPIKAASANCWIVERQSSRESPNYFTTYDFKTFNAISDVYPEKEFNWLNAEIIKWRQLDGSSTLGILYKPEDFDPHKKYPVIFNYYEQLSHRVYEYPRPEFTQDNINIPWFVSNGYLVFTPDIHYNAANVSNKVVGEWAFNSVVSAARVLSRFPYVDGSRMALQGHSFGALETSYLITHSRMFAAAAEAAGSTDPISAYLTLAPLISESEHYNKQTGIELSHEQYGATPWSRPDLYERNSAVLHADFVTTPLLIMHNKRDNQVQWRQGVELYMALRRLGKRVWLLQYDGGVHNVDGPDAEDYTIRLTQFFDYYLKMAKAPKWMVDGVPARFKQIDTGYDLDSTGRTP